MQENQEIRQKLRKIMALFAGAATAGERDAAKAALDRLQDRLRDQSDKPPADPPVEFRFSLQNHWSMRLFLALCRAKGYRPYRYPRMRRTSVCVRIGAHAAKGQLWPEYLEMNRLLTEHLESTVDQIIADCINTDPSDAEVVQNLPATGTSTVDLVD
jgi:hypothetical protein